MRTFPPGGGGKDIQTRNVKFLNFDEIIVIDSTDKTNFHFRSMEILIERNPRFVRRNHGCNTFYLPDSRFVPGFHAVTSKRFLPDECFFFYSNIIVRLSVVICKLCRSYVTALRRVEDEENKKNKKKINIKKNTEKS